MACEYCTNGKTFEDAGGAVVYRIEVQRSCALLVPYLMFDGEELPPVEIDFCLKCGERLGGE